MRKDDSRKTKLISINQVFIYGIWTVILLAITMFLSSKRNEYFQEIDNKIQSIVSKYDYIKDDSMTDKNNLYYMSGEDSAIQIRLEYDRNGYIIDRYDFEYKNYDNSSYKIDYYYDVINSILPDINIYSYKEQIEYAINNKLYEEDGSYMIRLNTEKYKYGYIYIHDNYYNYKEYNYDISIEFY